MIEIVTSCWRYDRCLTYHLSALVLDPPTAPVRATVYFTEEDDATVATLDYFAQRGIPGVSLAFRPLPRQSLMRRAIARDDAAKRTQADWLIFTDVDYLYSGTALREIQAELFGADDRKLYFTRNILSTSQEAGDALIAAVTAPGVYATDGASFEAATLPRAIGGSQIVSGQVAKEVGYLPGHKRFHKPHDTWRRTYEDKAWRQAIAANHQVYAARLTAASKVARIRHSKRGRFDQGCRN